jgi:hypothetical protein
MTEHEMKCLLYSYPKIPQTIKDKNAEIVQLRETKYSFVAAPTSKLDGMPSGAGIGDPTWQNYIMVTEQFDKILHERVTEIERLTADLHTIDLAMRALGQRNVCGVPIIQMRYFSRKSWAKIAAEMQYSESRLKELNRSLINWMVGWWTH